MGGCALTTVEEFVPGQYWLAGGCEKSSEGNRDPTARNGREKSSDGVR